MMAELPVIVGRDRHVGVLSLNRPAALNALTLEMCELMTEALLAWRDDPAVSIVMIDHAGDRGFCAGGDIRMLAESARGDGSAAREFFFVEYRLNHLLFTYPKPVIAFMDGVTMGGGVGISLPARYRVATERTVLAMPETGIGLFPDVGGGWYLPRLPHSVGHWLALTGERLKGRDCERVGLATDYVESNRLEGVKAALKGISADIGAVLDHAASRVQQFSIEPLLGEIDRLFNASSVEDLLEGLKAANSDWASAQLAILKTRSPQSLKVTFRQLQHGASAGSFSDHMALEYRIACRVVQTPDFLEGVRAVIVDKDNSPRWTPDTLEAADDALIDSIFLPLADGAEWTPIPRTDLEDAA